MSTFEYSHSLKFSKALFLKLNWQIILEKEPSQTTLRVASLVAVVHIEQWTSRSRIIFLLLRPLHATCRFIGLLFCFVLNVLVASYPTQVDPVIFFLRPKGGCVRVVQNPLILVQLLLEDRAPLFQVVFLFDFVTTPCWMLKLIFLVSNR